MKYIEPDVLKIWLDSGESIAVDVREPNEHSERHINGCKLLPLSKVSPQNLLSFGNKKVVLYCQSGARSQQACLRVMQELEGNEIEIYNLKGGINAWTKQGFTG